MDRPTLARRGYVLLTALLIGGLCAQALAANFQVGWEAYERGDYAAALREWRPLAEQGDAYAQYNLEGMYIKGRGVPQDDVEAMKWYRKAAEQGNASAQTGLGAGYALGRGVPEDDIQAYAWINIAAAQGDKNAQNIKEFIAESLTNEGRDRAQQLAREYWEKYVLPFRN